MYMPVYKAYKQPPFARLIIELTMGNRMRAQYVQMLLLALWGQAVIRRQMIAAKSAAAITSILRFISQGHGASTFRVMHPNRTRYGAITPQGRRTM